MSTNLCIEEHSLYRRTPRGKQDPYFFLVLVDQKVEENFTNWWNFQDDPKWFYKWLEPKLAGPLSLWMRTHFAFNCDRPKYQTSKYLKGLASTFNCNTAHGTDKWHMKCDPVGHGLLYDSRQDLYEVTTWGVYLDHRDHYKPPKGDTIFDEFLANPEKMALFGCVYEKEGKVNDKAEWEELIRIDYDNCPIIDNLVDMCVFNATNREAEVDVVRTAIATMAYVGAILEEPDDGKLMEMLAAIKIGCTVLDAQYRSTFYDKSYFDDWTEKAFVFSHNSFDQSEGAGTAMRGRILTEYVGPQFKKNVIVHEPIMKGLIQYFITEYIVPFRKVYKKL